MSRIRRFRYALRKNSCDGTANGAVDGSIGSAIEEGEAGDVVGGRMLEHVQVLARLGLGVARPHAPEETAHLPKGHQVRCKIDVYSFLKLTRTLDISKLDIKVST